MKNSDFKNKLKDVIRPLVLNEITAEPLKSSSKYQEPCELLEKVKKEVGDDVKVEFSPDSGKVVVESEINGKKYSLQISENGCDCYSVLAIMDGSERASLKNAKFDDIQKIIKETIKNKDRKKYTEKAYDKNVIAKKEEKKKEDKEPSDNMEEIEDIKKQIDHKPLETKERDIEDVVKGTSGMKDSTKFKKQVDADNKDKVKLKADKKNSSKEKLVQKVDGTSKMKALKESIKEAVREILKESNHIYGDGYHDRIRYQNAEFAKDLESSKKEYQPPFDKNKRFGFADRIQVACKNTYKHETPPESTQEWYSFLDALQDCPMDAMDVMTSDEGESIYKGVDMKKLYDALVMKNPNDPKSFDGEINKYATVQRYKNSIKEVVREVLNEGSVKDPSKEEMLDFLEKKYVGLGFDKDSAEVAIYWFSSDYHNGQWSNLYSALSTSPYTPSRLARSIESEKDDMMAQEMYSDLVDEYSK